MYQNQIIHVIIGFKYDISCIVRSEALRGHSDTSVHSALSVNAQYIMLKSLINVLRNKFILTQCG